MAVIWITKIQSAARVEVSIIHKHGLWRPIVGGRRLGDGETLTISPGFDADCREMLITCPADGSFCIQGPSGRLDFTIKPAGGKDYLHVSDAKGIEIVNAKLGETGAFLATEYNATVMFEESDLVLDNVEFNGKCHRDETIKSVLSDALKAKGRDMFYALSTSN
jgi:hypothetical protein